MSLGPNELVVPDDTQLPHPFVGPVISKYIRISSPSGSVADA